MHLSQMGGVMPEERFLMTVYYRFGFTFMQELICNIEFDQDEDTYVAKLRTEMGGLREYTGKTFEEVLNLVMIELQEEFA